MRSEGPEWRGRLSGLVVPSLADVLRPSRCIPIFAQLFLRPRFRIALNGGLGRFERGVRGVAADRLGGSASVFASEFRFVWNCAGRFVRYLLVGFVWNSRGGFVWNFGRAKLKEGAERALVNVVEARFVPVQQRIGGAGGEGAESGNEAVEGVAAVLVSDLGIEHVLFHGPIAVEAPVGGCHFFDQGVFDAVGGLETLHVLLEEELKVLFAFPFEDDNGGEQAVAHGVHGGALFAFGGDGPFGARAVSTGRLNAT